MRKLPKIDFLALWDRLPKSDRDAIGVLVLKEAVLRCAAGEYQGDSSTQGVRYLTPAGRQAAEREAVEISGLRDAILVEEFPDLLGSNPSPDHPYSTDLVWAEPIRFRVRAST